MSGTNRMILSESTMKNASESTLAKNLLNANEEAKKNDKKKNSNEKK